MVPSLAALQGHPDLARFADLWRRHLDERAGGTDVAIAVADAFDATDADGQRWRVRPPRSVVVRDAVARAADADARAALEGLARALVARDGVWSSGRAVVELPTFVAIEGDAPQRAAPRRKRAASTA